MGLIGKVFGAPQAVATLGAAVRDVAEVFTPNATAEAAAAAAQAQAALAQHAAEFGHAGSRFDRLIDGLNRLPRPALALGTLGLFVHAMADPAGFAIRMQGLAYVPEPLWWLLGAIVAFYFGAREAHYIRIRAQTPPAPPPVASQPHGANPALDEWHRAAAER